MDLTTDTPIDVPSPAVALIDSYLARLGGRKNVGVSEVRDILLDVRNHLWSPPLVTAAQRMELEALN